MGRLVPPPLQTRAVPARWDAGRSQRVALALILGLGALVSFSMVGVTVHDGFHPLALLASLLPLQLAALLWGFHR